MTTDDLHAHKRFYKEATAAPKDGGATVLIDGRQLRTPGKTAFLAPTLKLAEACAAEWQAQGDVVRPESMPVTRLVNVAIDHTPRTRDRIVESIAGYAATDLVCHRAEAPESLVKRQADRWDPLVAWAATTLNAPLTVVSGVIAADQAPEARAGFEAAAAAHDNFSLTALAHAVGMAGSGVIGFALAAGRLDAVAAFEAASLDDLWQLETWGEDHVARQRLDNLEAEFLALGRYFTALRG
ncbi:MAG: ATPase [Hyphomonadaceae bacterium]|nr:ATPase [Hyphomonadaceae bacterium]